MSNPIDVIVSRVEHHLADVEGPLIEEAWTLCIDKAYELGYRDQEAETLATQAMERLMEV